MDQLETDFSSFKQVNQSVYLGQMQLFALLRSLESLCDLESKIGDEKSFHASKVRFGQSAFLAFQDKQIHALVLKDKYLKVNIKGFGVFGPNGALPIHISEQIYERKLHQKDQTFNDFVDIFQNRLIALFYKSWRDAQDIVSLEGRDDWHFSRFIASLVGLANQQHIQPDVAHYSKFHYANLLLNQNMPSANIKILLENYFNTPVEIKENIGQWVDASEFSTHLSNTKKVRLGQGILLGDKIFDATQKFRVVIGPIEPTKYLKFLRGSENAKKLISWLDHYTRHQYQWDAEYIVDKKKIARQKLGEGLALGFTSWIGTPKHNPKVIIQY